MAEDDGIDQWFDELPDDDDDSQIDEYDLTATPNDFNVATIFNFIESGAVSIPGFQRNFVWDLKRSSKLIESLILGLPVPQIFLYEESRNKFLVIDGQQRLMTLYYFMQGRFPRKERRAELRRIFDEHGTVPREILADDDYFTPFKLSLAESLPKRPNKFKNLKYETLGDYKSQFELRPIRNVIVKQNVPTDDHSSIFEIFNRLNTGGINLRPQEIRTSLYHSDFYEMLYRVNTDDQWRRLLRVQTPDLHMKDVEILLRGFALLIDGHNYAPSMLKFLNQFSQKCKAHTDEQNTYLEQLFHAFLAAVTDLPDDTFLNNRTRRFNLALFEATFTAACHGALDAQREPDGALDAGEIAALAGDTEFQEASQLATTHTANVETRLARAAHFITAL